MIDPKPEKKWLCYAAAAVVGICLGLALLFSMDQTPEEALPPAVTEFIETTEETEATEPAIPEEEPLPWNLLLVNPWNRLPEDLEVELAQLEDGHAVDARIAADLQDMLAAMKEEDLAPLICSSYRTQEKQEFLYTRKVDYYRNRGDSQQEAEAEAGKWVAVPGTSEHQTGLALDIVDRRYQLLNEKQETTEVQIWLMAHSWEYGFILRYPKDKSETTGIYYEPWHYRYVGKEAAKQIFDQGICLEEYVAVG